MNIAIDIDDTLTNSFDYFLPFVAEFFGAEEATLRKNDVSYSTLPAEWKARELDFCRAYYDKVVEDTPFKEDAAEGVNELRRRGHKIIIITGRTEAFYTNPYETTRRELEKGGIAYDKLICTLDKASACVEEKIDVLIDDLIGNCSAVSKKDVKAIVFNGKGNSGIITDFQRVDNWQEAVRTITDMEKGFPCREMAERFLKEAEAVNPGPWGDHSRVAASCAEKIAAVCGLDIEKAYVTGLLHDVGRRFLVRDLGHIYYGYKYMTMLGYDDVARVCLSHSFPCKDTDSYIGKFDIPDNETEHLKELLAKAEFDDYDRLIQLCDALSAAEGVVDVEARMADVKRRYSNYPETQWNKNLEIKRYFEEKCGKDIYEIVK